MRPSFNNVAPAVAAVIIACWAPTAVPYGVHLSERRSLESLHPDFDPVEPTVAAEVPTEVEDFVENDGNVVDDQVGSMHPLSPEGLPSQSSPPEDVEIRFEIKTIGHIEAISATMKGRRPTDEDVSGTKHNSASQSMPPARFRWQKLCQLAARPVDAACGHECLRLLTRKRPL